MKSTAIIVTHVVNDAVTHGFVPAAKALGMATVLVTDHQSDHLKLAATDTSFSPDLILECDVFNPLDIIDTIINLGITPKLIFSNSDHLQTSTSIAAEFFNLPAKHWPTCLKAKNKYLTRKQLEQVSLPTTKTWLLHAGESYPDTLSFPLVAKPREGVASIDVTRCDNQEQLVQYCQSYWQKQSMIPILLEEFIDGPLVTLETLSDGEQLIAIGGFDVELSSPPHFIEKSATWNGPLSQQYQEQCLDQISQFGIGFGVCHSEFIITPTGPVLVEINYRSIGDGREFLLDNLAPYSWFKQILQLHAGEKISQPLAIKGTAHVHYLVAEQSGTVSGSSTSFKKQSGDVVVQHQALKSAGDKLVKSHSNKDYLSRLSLASPTGASLKDILEQSLNEIDLKVIAEDIA